MTGSFTKQLMLSVLCWRNGSSDGGVRVREQEHVRLLDLLEAPDRGAVEAVALGEAVLGQGVGGNGEVLHEPRKIAEAEVDDLDALALDEGQDLGGGALLQLDLPSRCAVRASQLPGQLALRSVANRVACL